MASATTPGLRKTPRKRHQADVLILGSGAAGLAAALHLPPSLHVVVLSKDAIRDGSTNWAQGGIAAVQANPDSFESHIDDTLRAGAGLCDEDVVAYTVSNGPAAIEHLVSLGLAFDRRAQGLDLTKEGGHSFRRVLHVADKTGRAVESTLVDQVLGRPNVEVLVDRIAIDVITSAKLGGDSNEVLGAYVYNRQTTDVEVIESRFVILATGGASKVYLYTSNPDGATGDGIAMAWRAGSRVANMEFNQFHPTCLYHVEAKSFLISEAVRGEGGRLLLPDGSPFMKRFDERAELASRDIVARAIDHEIKRLGVDCVFLDISHRDNAFIESHFPTILERCLRYGIDMRREPIPVVPAAHYTCGGVVVDTNGRTDVPGLYAVGEVACTGLHGANRLASNSLLECLVFAKSAAEHIAEHPNTEGAHPNVPDWDASRVTDSDEQVVLNHNWHELRRFMWDYVGIVRTTRRLERAQHRLDLLKREIKEYYEHHRVTADLIEMRNLVHVAELIVRCAMSRKESRGLHYTLDYPATLAKAERSLVDPEVDPLDVLTPRSARRSIAK